MHKEQCSAASPTPPPGPGPQPSTCPDWKPNRRPLVLQAGAQPTEPTGQGHRSGFKVPFDDSTAEMEKRLGTGWAWEGQLCPNCAHESLPRHQPTTE